MRVVSLIALIYLVAEELHWCVQEDSFISVFLGSFYIETIEHDAHSARFNREWLSKSIKIG